MRLARVCRRQGLDVLRPLQGEWEPARKAFYRRYLWVCVDGWALLALDNHSAGVLHPEAIDIYAALALAVPVTSYFGVIHLLPAGWRARWPRELVVACLGPCDIS
jgi:hypothetical protein